MIPTKHNTKRPSRCEPTKILILLPIQHFNWFQISPLLICLTNEGTSNHSIAWEQITIKVFGKPSKWSEIVILKHNLQITIIEKKKKGEVFSRYCATHHFGFSEFAGGSLFVVLAVEIRIGWKERVVFSAAAEIRIIYTTAALGLLMMVSYNLSPLPSWNCVWPFSPYKYSSLCCLLTVHCTTTSQVFVEKYMLSPAPS